MDKNLKNTKEESLSSLRKEIDSLEKEISDAKRKEFQLQAERNPVEDLYRWSAPERPYKPKDFRWYVTVGAISAVGIVVSILTGYELLVIAIIAILAILYAQNTIPPMMFTYEITNKGIRLGKKLYIWKQVPKFWITQRGEEIFLNFETIDTEASRLIILVGDGDIRIIARELIRFIDYLSPKEAKHDLFQTFTEGSHKSIGDFFDEESNYAPESKTNSEEQTSTRTENKKLSSNILSKKLKEKVR